MNPTNLFEIPDPPPESERFDLLFPDKGVKIERIVSTGQNTPAGEWYDQNRDEWVALLQGEAHLRFQNNRTIILKSGDHVLIQAHEKHRVDYASLDPPCIWLAVHGDLT